jgi:shikimate dehydrogenase
MADIRLGLIGDNIAASRAPELHRIAGRLCGLEVSYDLLIPKHLELTFDLVFDWARDQGYRGLNITYPYKEAVVRRLEKQDESVRLPGACNTVLFDPSGPAGFNTDYTGFQAAFRNTFRGCDPGVVAFAGCGGVGRAISFALVQLGARTLHLYDSDSRRSDGLAKALTAGAPHISISIAESIYQACEGADGLINCTPLGMVGYGGSAFPAELIPGRRWIFDAVYTPVDTPLLQTAVAADVSAMSGYELFFNQGVDAFCIFTGQKVDYRELREALRT